MTRTLIATWCIIKNFIFFHTKMKVKVIGIAFRCPILHACGDFFVNFNFSCGISFILTVQSTQRFHAVNEHNLCYYYSQLNIAEFIYLSKM